MKLTDEGRRVLRLAEPQAKKVDRRILDALPGTNQQQSIAALLTMVHALEAAAGKSIRLS